MRQQSVAVRARFYVETALGLVSGLLFLVTLFTRDWIEVAFRIDPDQGQGWVEWLVVGVLLAATLSLSSLARFEWRRTSVASTSGRL